MAKGNTGDGTLGGFRMGYRDGAAMGPVQLAWQGSPIPDWLRTRYLKTGPGLFSVGAQHYRHWFDGLALLKAFRIENQAVTFQSRFLDSPDYLVSTRENRRAFTEFATAPERNFWQRLKCTLIPTAQFGKNESINLQFQDGGVTAISDLPGGLNIDPDDLRTLDEFKNDDLFIMTSTPHPQRDSRRSSWTNCGMGLSWKGFGYHVFQMPDGSHRPKSFTFIPRPKPAYMHSVGMSDRYMVLTEHPMFASMPKFFTLALRGKAILDAFEFDARRPTTFFVVDKENGDIAARVEAPSCFYFHAANVFDDGDDVVVDLCSYPDDHVIKTLFLDFIQGPKGGETVPATLTRNRIHVPTGKLIQESLSDYSFEFPVTSPRVGNLPYRYTYGVSVKPDLNTDHSNLLVKIDTRTGQALSWFEPGCYPNEPFMIPRPGAEAEDDGVVLCVVLDARIKASVLLVLDAASFTEIGRATVPGIIPFGLHGQILPIPN